MMPRFLTALRNAKVAGMEHIYQQLPIADPLDDPALGPARASGNNREMGGNIGRVLGAAGGALAGGALGGHLTDFGAPGGLDETAGQIAGGVAGGIGGMYAGKALGKGLGSLSYHLYSPERRAAEFVRRADPATGLAYIRQLESNGKTAPSVLQAMRDAYNTRRTGLQHQLAAGVAIPPGRRPDDLGIGPTALPV